MGAGGAGVGVSFVAGVVVVFPVFVLVFGLNRPRVDAAWRVLLLRRTSHCVVVVHR